jgi:hypothetical protein
VNLKIKEESWRLEENTTKDKDKKRVFEIKR